MPARLVFAGLIAPAFLLSPCELLPTRLAGATHRAIPILRTLPIHQNQPHTLRHASSSSSSRWLTRQSRDPYTKASSLSSLKSRAAFKLLEINDKHHLFKPGQTVVDLGFAPGSWSQVAKSRVGEGGKVVGIDVIPAQPPRGVSALQGDFLGRETQERLREFVREGSGLGRRREEDDAGAEEKEQQSVIERARASSTESASDAPTSDKKLSLRASDSALGRVVDVVLSDMMMNTSGNAFRDHAGSMDLCTAALLFSSDCLVTGGHFLCKFYQGAEDKGFETRMKRLFERVYRIKPESSRKESREAYFVGLRRRRDVGRREVFPEEWER